MHREYNVMKVAVGKDNKIEIYATPVDDTTTRASSNLRKIRVNIIDAESGESQEEVDVYTSADSVLTDPNTGETILDYIDYRLKFTNSSPMPISVGGYPKGTTFREVPLSDILNGLLYPNTPPNGELVADKPTDIPYELGVDINPISFTINYEQTSYTIQNIQLLKDDVVVRNFDINPDTTSSTLSYAAVIDRDAKFYAKIIDSHNNECITNSLQYRFVHPIYAGCMNNTDVINAENIKKLNRVIYDDDITGVCSLGNISANNQRIVIAVKPEWKVNKILDTNMNDITSIFTDSIMNIEVIDGDTQQYDVFYTDINYLHTFTNKEIFISL